MKSKLLAFIAPLFITAIFAILAIGSGEKSNSKSSSSSSESKTKKETYESTSATCSYCGKSFYKNSGYMLSGHSEVFCSQNCATNWGWQHNIGVN